MAVWRDIYSAREGVLFGSDRSRDEAAELEQRRYERGYRMQQNCNAMPEERRDDVSEARESKEAAEKGGKEEGKEESEAHSTHLK